MTAPSQTQPLYPVPTGIATPTANPLPAYSSSGAGVFVPGTSVYRQRGNNTRVLRRALGAAATPGSTSVCDIVAIGDSGCIGFNGTTTQSSASVPFEAATELGILEGLPVIGSGVDPCITGGQAGVLGDRWTSTGAVDVGSFYPGILLMPTGATATYTSLRAGTSAGVTYVDTGASFTYTVDGGAPKTVTTGGTAAVKIDLTTGLANTVHVVKVTATGNYVNLISGVVDTPGVAGIRMHNLCLGGTTAAYGGPVTNWNDTTNSYYGFAATRRASVALLGATPAMVLCCIGGNDITTYYQQPSAIMAGITAMRAFWPAADFALLQMYTNSATPNIAQYLQQRVQLADTLNCEVYDWQDRIGDLATAIADGDIGADNIHPKFGTGTIAGREVGAMFAA